MMFSFAQELNKNLQCSILVWCKPASSFNVHQPTLWAEYPTQGNPGNSNTFTPIILLKFVNGNHFNLVKPFQVCRLCLDLKAVCKNQNFLCFHVFGAQSNGFLFCWTWSPWVLFCHMILFNLQILCSFNFKLEFLNCKIVFSPSHTEFPKFLELRLSSFI